MLDAIKQQSNSACNIIVFVPASRRERASELPRVFTRACTQTRPKGFRARRVPTTTSLPTTTTTASFRWRSYVNSSVRIVSASVRVARIRVTRTRSTRLFSCDGDCASVLGNNIDTNSVVGILHPLFAHIIASCLALNKCVMRKKGGIELLIEAPRVEALLAAYALQCVCDSIGIESLRTISGN